MHSKLQAILNNDVISQTWIDGSRFLCTNVWYEYMKRHRHIKHIGRPLLASNYRYTLQFTNVADYWNWLWNICKFKERWRDTSSINWDSTLVLNGRERNVHTRLATIILWNLDVCWPQFKFVFWTAIVDWLTSVRNKFEMSLQHCDTQSLSWCQWPRQYFRESLTRIGSWLWIWVCRRQWHTARLSTTSPGSSLDGNSINNQIHATERS